MAAPILAWSDTNLYELPDGDYIWGREFELLPAGTMFTAGARLHGVVGLSAEPRDDKTCLIDPNGPTLIYGTRDTEDKELDGYRVEIAEGFRIKQLQGDHGP